MGAAIKSTIKESSPALHGPFGPNIKVKYMDIKATISNTTAGNDFFKTVMKCNILWPEDFIGLWLIILMLQPLCKPNKANLDKKEKSEKNEISYIIGIPIAGEVIIHKPP